MQMGFHFDQSLCVNCCTCVVACKDSHDVPAGPASYIRIRKIEKGKCPEVSVHSMFDSCRHCAEPACVVVCPAGAISKREGDGVVLVDRDKCRQSARCGIITGYKAPLGLTMGERQAPCQVTCPAHLQVPAYLALIARGKFREALDVIRRRMPLPSVCGRVCNHPCEGECTRGKLDEPLAIASLRRFAADVAGAAAPESAGADAHRPLPAANGRKVAIVGSGPAGLAAAYDLVRMGYGVTIFEALPVAGGMLAVGIPEYRMPRAVLKRDIDYIVSLGVEIKTGTPLGPGLGFEELAGLGYAATFIATGSHRGVGLKIAGLEAGRSLTGVEFLREVNMGRAPEMTGRKVLVLGGGNVAIDCARTALRLGAAEARLACVESRENMPAFAEEIEEAEQEGIILHPAKAFTRAVFGDSRNTGMECLDVESMEFDLDGVLRLDSVRGSEQVIPFDVVIQAVGQAPDTGYLEAAGGLKLTPKGAIEVNPETLETSRRGVFAGGDAVSPAGTVIQAIAAGQRAAVYMDRYLKGEVLGGGAGGSPVKAADMVVEIPPETARAPRQRMPYLAPTQRRRGFAEVALGFEAAAAQAEAQRCLNCAGSLCRDACPYGAPQFGAEEDARMQKCDFCSDRLAENRKPVCVEACIMHALDSGPMEELRAEYGDLRQTEGFTAAEGLDPSIVFTPKKGARGRTVEKVSVSPPIKPWDQG